MLTDKSSEKLLPPEHHRVYRRTAWTKLVFDKQHEFAPDPDGRHVIYVLTSTSGDYATLMSDHGHAWFRLVRPDNSYASVGLWPDESTGIEPEHRPGLVMPGMLMHPDKYDRQKRLYIVNKFPVNEEQFDKVCAYIESIQARREKEGIPFSMMEHNCVGFIKDVLSQIDIFPKADTLLPEFIYPFIPKAVSQPVVKFVNAIPEAIRQLSREIFSFFQQIYIRLLYIFGGKTSFPYQWMLDDAYAMNARLVELSGIEPMFNSIRCLFTRKIDFLHVRQLQVWQKQNGGEIYDYRLKKAPLESAGVKSQ